MYVFAEVDAYLQLLSYTDVYKTKERTEREQAVFTAYEKLTSYYDDIYLTPKVIGLQTVYMIEGEQDDHALFKRQGVKSMQVEDLSFSYDITQQISPDVVQIIAREQAKEAEAKPSGARVGRLI
ncbi:hypothetical protein ACEPPU_24115 [Priestia aryabhattai]|uniref:hypothetical protein n=1 Tax=Priestia aryabhattai TaxID=412384 RepID=UPI0035AC1873